MKLRLNTPLQDLAYRFVVSVSTISRIFSHWIVAMDTRLFGFVLARQGSTVENNASVLPERKQLL